MTKKLDKFTLEYILNNLQEMYEKTDTFYMLGCLPDSEEDIVYGKTLGLEEARDFVKKLLMEEQ